MLREVVALAPAPYRRPPDVRTFGGVCRVCGYPKAWHKQNAAGDWVLNAETRASVGNRVPPVCWRKDYASANLNHARLPFVGRRVA